MSTNTTVTDLFTEYQKNCHTKLTLEQFTTLLTFFPSLLVIAADGVIEEEEWIYVRYISRSMAETFIDDFDDNIEVSDLKKLYYSDLEYLVDSLRKWENKFLVALKEYLEDNPELKDDIVDIMYMFAEASDNDSIQEERVIQEVMERLNIEEED